MECAILELEAFTTWFKSLDEESQIRVAASILLLKKKGVTLGFPHSSGVFGSAYSALRELRVKAHGKQIRVFYAFDPERQAVLLIAGDKVGDDRFYERLIPRADQLWGEYLAWFSKMSSKNSGKKEGKRK